MKWAVTVPSNRPDQLKLFKEAWKRLFDLHDVNLIVVYDNEKTWKTIPDFIPRRTDMIRSWGFYLAWQTDCDYILTLDDDVRPVGDPFAEYEKEFLADRPLSRYLSIGSLTDSGLEMRGFPYIDRTPRPVGVQYGGWHNVLDYDAVTQLSCVQTSRTFSEVNIPVPLGVPTTCCIMNCAFRRDLVPIMWQLPLLDGLYNRFGDIWSGLFIKKYLDATKQVMLINGKASIWHERASNPFTNLQREAPGLPVNEELWDALEGETYEQITDSAAEHFKQFNPEYAKYFIESRNAWMTLFKEI